MDLYEKIKADRETQIAPVDTMGCHTLGVGVEGNIKKFQILIALLFSSQTKDNVTFQAVTNLINRLGELTPEKILNSSENDLHKDICKIGFHNKKLKYLLEISKIVTKGMPETMEEVLKLPGVGEKMAILYLFHGCNINEGISVDTHVHRLSNRLGLVSSKTPEKTRILLEKIFPKKEWPEINRVLVGFGQLVCQPVNPRCSDCCVKESCPSSMCKFEF